MKNFSFVFLILFTLAYTCAAIGSSPPASSNTIPILKPTRVFYFLMGGNMDPSFSQYSMERNIVTAQHFAKNTNHVSLTTLFAQGTHGEFDVLYTRDYNPTAATVIGYVFGRKNKEDKAFPQIHWQYIRSNGIRDLDGSITRENILDELEDYVDRLKPTEHLKIYYNGHGLFLNDDPLQSVLAINKEDVDQISVQEITTQLDQLPEQAHVQMLLTQCFSGGFTQINYVGGKKGNNISPHRRCALCATLDIIPATGGYDVEAMNEEYSKYFFKAYNEAKLEVDFNKDGIIGADEAHAYATAHLKTIDVPVKTSEDLLIKELASKTTVKMGAWADLLDYATPYERYVLITLEQNLQQHFTPNQYVARTSIRALDALEQNIATTEEKIESTYWEPEIKPLIEQWILPALYNIVPYLFNESNMNNPGYFIDFSEDEQVKVHGYIRKHPHLNKIAPVVDRWVKMADAHFDDKVEKAAWARLLQLATVIDLRFQLYQSSEITLIEKYNQLIECEAQPFFPN